MANYNNQISGKIGVDVILNNKNYVSFNKDGSVVIRCGGIVYNFDTDDDMDGFKKFFNAIDKSKANYVETADFISACLYGMCKPDDIDFYVEYWHTHDVDMTLREFLGLSQEEYELLEKSDYSIIEEFLDKRKKKVGVNNEY